MGAAASAISQQDLSNEEKITITKVFPFSIAWPKCCHFCPIILLTLFDRFPCQVLQDKYHAMREDETTKDAPEIEVFGALST